MAGWETVQWSALVLVLALGAHGASNYENFPSTLDETASSHAPRAELNASLVNLVATNASAPDCTQVLPAWVRDYTAWHASQWGKPNAK